MSDIVTQLRKDAEGTAAASKLIADAKSFRNQQAGDVEAYYENLTPQQTISWQAADEIERLRAVVCALRLGGDLQEVRRDIYNDNRRLRAALERIAGCDSHFSGDVVDIARAALWEKA